MPYGQDGINYPNDFWRAEADGRYYAKRDRERWEQFRSISPPSYSNEPPPIYMDPDAPVTNSAFFWVFEAVIGLSKIVFWLAVVRIIAKVMVG